MPHSIICKNKKTHQLILIPQSFTELYFFLFIRKIIYSIIWRSSLFSSYMRFQRVFVVFFQRWRIQVIELRVQVRSRVWGLLSRLWEGFYSVRDSIFEVRAFIMSSNCLWYSFISSIMISCCRITSPNSQNRYFLTPLHLNEKNLSNSESNSSKFCTTPQISLVSLPMISQKSLTKSLSHTLLTSSICLYILVSKELQRAVLLCFYFVVKFYLELQRFNDFEQLLRRMRESCRGIDSRPLDSVCIGVENFLFSTIFSSACILALKPAISISQTSLSLPSAAATASFLELFQTSSCSISYRKYFDLENLNQIGSLGQCRALHFQFADQIFVVVGRLGSGLFLL